jgi:hypothetical protein
MVGTQGGVTFDPELGVDFRTEQNRTEQNRTEQNRTEQNRTEQNRTEQNRRGYSALTFHSRTRRRFYQHPP